MRWLATGVALGLIALTAFNVGATQGYEHGKSDAQNSLKSWGVAVLEPSGACRFYDRDVEKITLPPSMRAHLTLLVRPQ